MKSAFRNLTFTLIVLLSVSGTNVLIAQEYALDFSKTQTFLSSCGGIASDRLMVSNDSCDITTRSLKISDVATDHQKVVLVSVKINKEGKLGKSDKAWVKLLVNGKVNKSYSIKGDGMLENYKRQDKIVLTQPSDVSVQVILKSSTKGRAWVINSGDIEIAVSDYTEVKDLRVINGNFNGKVVKLNWSTPSEMNNNYFTVERSKDGTNFEKAALVKGAGTSEENHQYAFIDHNLFAGNTYYRLKQINFSGKEKQVGEIINIPTPINEPTTYLRKDNVSINALK